ncbi:apolipoprotein N-acyltransferase [Orbaceae bacterium ESL0721]|nr:apolipoprotein N-acyltransferase [Orbaceae bacterium ESL0721]
MSKLWLTLLLSFGLGAIAVFSFAPFHIWPTAFISYCSLLALIAGQTNKRAMLITLCWGIGYFAAGVHWIYVSIRQYGDLPILVALSILALLILYLSLYPMLFGLILRALNQYAPSFSFIQLVIAAPLIWQVTEYLRGHILSGFSWLQLGYSELDSPLRGYFPIVGIDGVTLITTIVSGLIVYILSGIVVRRGVNPTITERSQSAGSANSSYHNCFYHKLMCLKFICLKFINNREKMFKHKINAFIALILLFFAPFLFNNHQWTVPTQSKISVALIQGNIAQSLRWNNLQLANTLTTYQRLTDANLDKDIIIWPEAAITDFELNQQSYLHHLDEQAHANHATVAVGLLDYRPNSNDFTQGKVYNSLVVLGDETPYQYMSQNRYEKHHLVPFGEFTPLASLLEPVANLLDIPMSSMSRGNRKQPPLVMHNFKFTTAICYEVILSQLIWQNFTPDTDFLLTVSNDAWFGDTIGPLQHLQMAQARALEFGRPLIRSTNSGVTAIINEQGEITDRLPQFETAVLTATLSPFTGLTPYARWGNTPYFIVLLLFLAILVGKVVKMRVFTKGHSDQKQISSHKKVSAQKNRS